jgi:hypothetical protein
VHMVVSTPAMHLIVIIAAVEIVIAIIAAHVITPVAAVDVIITISTAQAVIAVAAIEAVVATTAMVVIIALVAFEIIVQYGVIADQGRLQGQQGFVFGKQVFHGNASDLVCGISAPDMHLRNAQDHGENRDFQCQEAPLGGFSAAISAEISLSFRKPPRIECRP